MLYPLYAEIAYVDPIDIFSLFAKSNNTIFLDSAYKNPLVGRYSFIATDPFAVLVSKQKNLYLDGKKIIGHPFQKLQSLLENFRQNNIPELPPFQGGVAGIWGYDLVQHLENIQLCQIDDMQFPDMVVGFYDVVVAFDHLKEKGWVFSTGYPVTSHDRKVYAQKRLNKFLKLLQKKPEEIKPQNFLIAKKAIHANFTAREYRQAVERVKNYILAGDIFEANFTQRFHTLLPFDYDYLSLYKKLRQLNAAPFAALLNFGNVKLLSASPERFLQVWQNKIEARPIKGTIKRSLEPEEDKRLAAQLLQSKKDQAENIMIVDLLRNDLSRVCQDHSVRVSALCALETYATVHHLVSVIHGELGPAYSSLDLLQVAFPGGSITGAPKIRAMEIIANLESHCRGPYCGSIGYIDFNGNMDLSIVIRTFAIKDYMLTFQAGGAIVLDSEPYAEYEESLLKAYALKKVLTDDITY